MDAPRTSPTPGAGWLYGPARDLGVLVGPWLVALAFVLPQRTLSPQAGLAAWTSQFVLGNTTHVILTFLLLGVRRDILHATPSQARTVIGGSLSTFLLVLAISIGVHAAAPTWSTFPLAVVGVFGTHHRLSQAKGLWSLYNLRASTLGDRPPSALERSLQQAWVSVGLLAVMVTWLFVPTASNRSFPLLQAIPSEPAMLPRWVAWALAAGWAGFVGFTLFALARAGSRRAKLVHIASHGAAVSAAILMPVWGAIVWGAMHGLEYYFLCSRMMEPREGDAPSALGRFFRADAAGRPAHGAIWLVMALSMLPLIGVGLVTGPLGGAWISSDAAFYATTLANALVASHYFADAFIYRFRIPDVRKVALRRLGFAGPPRPAPAEPAGAPALPQVG